MHDRVCPPGGCVSRSSRAAGWLSLIVDGMSPQAAAAACRAEPGDRLPAPGGATGRAASSHSGTTPCTPVLSAERLAPDRTEREILAWRGQKLGAGPAGDRHHRRASRLDGREGAAPGGLLAASTSAS